MRKIFATVTAVHSAIRLLINPGNGKALLKLGNLLTNTSAFSASVERAKSDPGAEKLIAARFRFPIPSILELEKLPEGTLGKAYSQHMIANKLQVYPFRQYAGLTEAEYLRERQREIHDLLHPLFDLGIDASSEAALNAFVMAQTYSPISTLIVLGASIHLLFTEPQKLGGHFERIFSFWNLGRKTPSIFSVKWEDLLICPLENLRKQLGFEDAMSLSPSLQIGQRDRLEF